MTSAEARQAVAAIAERDLTVRGTRVRVLAAGAGDPLLYLHDSCDQGLWAPVLSGLAEHFTVWRPDHPGRRSGRGSPPRTRRATRAGSRSTWSATVTTTGSTPAPAT